jgi:CheY-like chemotaxis protein
LPVLAMTAHALARDREKCIEAGMNDYISKPLDPATLVAVLEKWLPETASPTLEPAVSTVSLKSL